MGNSIHRNGDRYREWSTVVDAYTTEPLTRAEMFDYLETFRRDQHRCLADIEARLARADKRGTSALDREPRDATRWDTERCERCETFHHAYAPREDGSCKGCGEGADDVSHRPPCPARRRR